RKLAPISQLPQSLASRNSREMCGKSVGLEQLVTDNHSIYRAEPSRSWPGEASIEVVNIWLHKGLWNGDVLLGATRATRISSFLTEEGTVSGNPERLSANMNRCFQGSIILGMGFVLSEGEARSLISKDSKNAEVIYPYLNGSDVNSTPNSDPSRWVINF